MHEQERGRKKQHTTHASIKTDHLRIGTHCHRPTRKTAFRCLCRCCWYTLHDKQLHEKCPPEANAILPGAWWRSQRKPTRKRFSMGRLPEEEEEEEVVVVVASAAVMASMMMLLSMKKNIQACGDTGLRIADVVSTPPWE